MKTAILINDFSNGGAEKVASGIINNSGNDYVVIQIWPSKFNEINVNSTTLIKKKKFLPLDLLFAVFYLFKYVRDQDIRIVNSHLFWSNYINIIVSLFTKHKSVLTHCVSFQSKFERNRVLYNIHWLLTKIAIKLSNENIFKSTDMKDEYNKIFRFNSGIVIYNPLNCEKIERLSLEKVDFNFDQNINYIICVGRFHKTKRQSLILEVLINLSPSFHVIFLGDGSEKSFCEEKSRSLGLEHRTHFLGQVNNPYPFYKQAKLYISTSVSEGFPNTLIEAIALNCLPIVYDCKTGPKEILSLNYSNSPTCEFDGYIDYQLGILVEILNVDSYVRAIEYISKNNKTIDNDMREKLIYLLQPELIYNKYRSVNLNSF